MPSTSTEVTPGLIVHGGAGAAKMDGARLARYRAGLAAACEAGFRSLSAGDGALAAVEAAVRAMEASGAFNAGRGSCLNAERQVECDAAIMEGAGLRAGACGALRGFAHPVSLARRILEETDHVLIVGDGAARLADGMGLERETAGPEAARLEEFDLVEKKLAAMPRGQRLGRLMAALRHGAEKGESGRLKPAIDEGDTVGAVAIDAAGRLAAAVSTGGLWLKLPGRVGDSAIPGAGLYADDASGAVSATGVGEAILRLTLSRRACDAMAAGLPASAALARAVDEMSARIGKDTAGLVGIDRKGKPGAAFNTEAMGRAWIAQGMDAPLVAVARDEQFV